MILKSSGEINVYCDQFLKIKEFNQRIIISFIEKCNRLIRLLNSKQYSENDILIPLIYKNPKLIQCSYLYDISDYNTKILLKPFYNFFTDFVIIEDDPLNPLHLLYCKSCSS